MTRNPFDVFLGTMYVFGMLFAAIVFISGTIKQRRDKAKLSSSIQGKLMKGMDVTADDVKTMAKGLSVSPSAVAPVVARLLVSVDDAVLYDKVKVLSQEIARGEPLSDLPEDLRPFFARVTELCMASPQSGDHAMVSPIRTAVVSLNEAANKNKAWQRFLTWLGILGFIIGAWGLYLTWASPNAKDIQTIVQKAVRENMVQQSPSTPGMSASTPLTK